MSSYVNPDGSRKKKPKIEIDPLLRKKIVAQYSFLRIEVEYQKTQFDHAVKAFDKHFNPQIEDRSNSAGPIKLPNITAEDKKLPMDVDKAYKKLAKKIHPDKPTGDDSSFQDLRAAVNSHDVGKILELASEFNVDISAETGINMQELYIDGIQKLEQQLQQWMTTAAWQWYHSEGDARERIEQGILEIYK